MERSGGSGSWTDRGGSGGAADEERRRRYAEARAFVDGVQWEGARRRGETRLTANYARALVRKTAAYVFPAPATFRAPAGLGDEDAAARAELVLADIVAALDLPALDVALCVEAATLGDAAIKVTWEAAGSAGGRRPVRAAGRSGAVGSDGGTGPGGRREAGGAVGPGSAVGSLRSTGAGMPRVAAVDPATLVVETAADDPRRVLAVTQFYALPPERLIDLGWLMPGTADPGARALPVAERWTAGRWRVEVAGQRVADADNPYGWIPYLVLANDPEPHAFWGRTDLADLYDVCREINRRVSTLSRVLELSGAPIAVLENVDGSDGIAVRPGATWELPEGSRAYLLDLLSGGGVGLHVQFLELLFRALHDLSETPRTAFGDGGRDLSGAALEVEVQPLVQKVARKRRAWDAFYRERNGRLLDLLERFGGEPLGGARRMETVWPSVLPSDVDGAVRNAALLVREGIHSRRTAVAALGGADPEGEFRRVLDEGESLRSGGTPFKGGAR